MAEDNPTNLPILDDIIEPGDTDKAVHQPPRRIPSAIWPEEHGNDLASADPETDAVPTLTSDDLADTPEQRTEALPDIDALTEEILASVRGDIEQLLRLKIRQTLEHHFSGDSESD